MMMTGTILAAIAILLLLKGKRGQSRSLIALGVIAMVLSVGVLGTHALGVNWDRLKPYALLEYEIRSAAESDPNRAAELTYEVKRRLLRSKLDPERLWPLVESALEAQKDPSAVWTAHTLDLIETYDDWVGLSPDQILDFRKNAIRTVIEVRPEVRIGDTLPILFRTWDSRTSTRFNAWKDYRILSCTLGGKALAPGYVDTSYWVRRTGESYPPESVFTLAQMDMADTGLAAGLAAGLEVGEHPLVLEIEHRIHEFYSDEPLATWVETIEVSIDVMPQSINEIDERAAPEPSPIKGKVSVDTIYVQPLSSSRSAIWVYLNLDDVESACSFELLARSAAGEIPLGFVHFIPPNDPTGEGNRSIYKISMETNRRIVAEKADLVFRAAPQAINSGVRVVGPWLEDFVISDVPIRWPPRTNSRVQVNEYLTALGWQEVQSSMRSIDRGGRLKGAPEAGWR